MTGSKTGTLLLFLAAAFFCGGCEQVKEKVAEHKKKVTVAEEAAAMAQAKFAARAAVRPAGGPGKAGAALASLLCSSPRLMEDIEGNMDLLEALSGEGGDKSELKRQFLESRAHYRSILEKELPARGATFEEFSSYAMDQGADQKQKFKALAAEKCPRGDKDLVEKTAGGIMYYFTDKR